jgi:anaerobic dimethyl sulfoxide reductase subunit B (iron-sulfur subunit)
MGKCTGCNDKIDNGETAQCVAACPSRALDFAPIEVLRERYGDIGQSYTSSEVYPLPDSSYTLPAFFIKPHKNAISIDGNSARIANMEEV